MKRLATALVAACLAAGIAGVAHAAKKAEGAYKPEQTTKGMADTPAIMASSGLKCTVKNAAHVGENTTKIDGKSVKQNIYEVACAEGPGYFLAKPENQPVTTISCIQAKAGYDAAGGKSGMVCKLPENGDLNAQIQPVVAAAGARCTVNGVAYIGSSPTQKVDRFEVSCTEGGGYMVDAPGAGSTFQLSATNCLAASTIGYQCKLTAKPQQIAPIAALAAGADKACQVSDARWVGVDPKTGNVFYEVACTGKAGFMMETSKAGALVKSTDCVAAAGIGGGCTLTDVAVARAGAAQGYTSVLAQNKVTCTPQDYREIGEETAFKRKVVEFKCPEHPEGLVAYIPQAGATRPFMTFDCLAAEGRGLQCQYSSKDAIKAMLTKAATAGGKSCTVFDYNNHGPSGDGDMVEISCSAAAGGAPGWVMDLPRSRAKPVLIEDCKHAAFHSERCVLPANKLG